MTMYPKKNLAIEMIMDVARELRYRGYGLGDMVSISVRMHPDKVIITDMDFFLRHLEEEDLISIDTEGKILEHSLYFTPSLDMPLHLQIYNACPSALGVIMAQPPHVLALSASGRGITRPLTVNSVFSLGPVPYVPYGPASLPQGFDARFSPDDQEGFFGTYRGLVLGNRGIVTWGDNVYDALKRVELAEQSAMCETILGAEGKNADPLGKDEVWRIIQLRKKYRVETGYEDREIEEYDYTE